MEGSSASWGPIFSGLLGGLVVAIMIFTTKDKSRVEGDIRHLEFSLLFKLFAFATVPFAVMMLYAITQSHQGQEIIAAVIGLGFFAAGIFFPYQAFFVKFSYDEDSIYYKSPLAGERKESWSNLDKVGYSWFLQSDYIVVKGIGRIWCSNMLNGHGELMDFISSRNR